MVRRPTLCLRSSSWFFSDRHIRVVVAAVLLVNAHTWGLNSVSFVANLPQLSIRDSNPVALTARSSPMPSFLPTTCERRFNTINSGMGQELRTDFAQGHYPGGDSYDICLCGRPIDLHGLAIYQIYPVWQPSSSLTVTVVALLVSPLVTVCIGKCGTKWTLWIGVVLEA